MIVLYFCYCCVTDKRLPKTQNCLRQCCSAWPYLWIWWNSYLLSLIIQAKFVWKTRFLIENFQFLFQINEFLIIWNFGSLAISIEGYSNIFFADPKSNLCCCKMQTTSIYIHRTKYTHNNKLNRFTLSWWNCILHWTC